MKKIVFLLIASTMLNNVFAATLDLRGGESAFIQANVTASINCRGQGQSSPDNGSAQCYQDNANLRVQINQLQNDLYRCQTDKQQPKIWNCTYTCGGNNGMGSDTDKSVACRAAKQDSGVQCASQCECVQN